MIKDKTDDYERRQDERRANTRQVGGGHYGGGDYQHWDLMADLDAGYFPGNITKYTERHDSKAGRTDLEKALHYAEKQHEVAMRRAGVGQAGSAIGVELASGRRIRPSAAQRDAVYRYCDAKVLTTLQTLVFATALLHRDDTGALVDLCRLHLAAAYPEPASAPATGAGADAAARPGTPEDGGHHEEKVMRVDGRYSILVPFSLRDRLDDEIMAVLHRYELQKG